MTKIHEKFPSLQSVNIGITSFFHALKEYATNEKACTIFVQDVSHNMNLMRIGKWRRLNSISLCLNIPTQRFFVCLRAPP